MPDRAAGRTIEERVQLRFGGVTLLHHLDDARFQNGELRLCFQDVLLRRLAGGVAHLGNANSARHQLLPLAQDLHHGVGVVEHVVSLDHSRAHAQLHRQVLLELRAGFLGGDLTAQFQLAGIRNLLRHGDADVAGGLDAESLAGEWPATAGISEGESWIGQAASCAGR